MAKEVYGMLRLKNRKSGNAKQPRKTRATLKRRSR